MDNEKINNEINETEQVTEEVTVVEEKEHGTSEAKAPEEPVTRIYEEPVRRVYEEPTFYSNIPVYTQEVKEKKKGGKFWIAATAILTAICLITTSFAIGTVVGKDSSAPVNKTQTDRPTSVTNDIVQTPEYTPTI
ncbi:MAG: hypothetical protein E7477_00915, partial [Ruminococcaceae bacterium]|nr:hypothetical protein [Oscillospiraceae bacterium]